MKINQKNFFERDFFFIFFFSSKKINLIGNHQ